jgi:membrane-associated phospholipid phosphatase
LNNVFRSILPKHPWRLLLGVFAAVAATTAAFSIDCPLSSWCLADGCPGELARFLKVAEAFGNGFGVVLILLAVHQLDPRRRPKMPRLIAMSLGAGLAANGVKMLIARTRPREFGFDGGVAETFGRWLPMLGEGSAGQSFPSAHTATAVGLAIALSWLYPRGRLMFGALAVLVACQRIESGYHFASDTVAGAAVGIFIALACLRNGRLVRRFDRIENCFAGQKGRAEAERARAVADGPLASRSDDPSRPLAA